MSIVAVQIGEIANPRKNSASVKPVMPISRSSTRMAGNSEATARIQLVAISSERAICRLPVRRSRWSVTTLPSSSATIAHNSVRA